MLLISPKSEKNLGRASSALRSEFIPFQFIRKGKELNQLLALVDFKPISNRFSSVGFSQFRG
jgi:hypothetical protein